MNDAHDQSGVSDAPATGGAVAISPGHWLRDERERQGLTLQRIAADMHLSVTIIEAIEQNRFAAVGAPVFARGYLRKYASLLQVPVNRIIELYDKLDDAPRDVDPIPLAQRAPEPALRPAIRQMFGAGGKNTSRRAPPLPWIFAVALLAVAAFAAAWFFGRTAPPSVPPAQQTESSAIAEPQNTLPRKVVASEVAAPLPVAQSGPTTPAPRATRPMGTPPPGKVRVRLTFARESWVEVYDANGNQILYAVGRTDSPRMVDVEPPAVVVLGDAEAVSAEANNKLIAVPRKNIQGSVARFTIAADGTVK